MELKQSAGGSETKLSGKALKKARRAEKVKDRVGDEGTEQRKETPSAPVDVPHTSTKAEEGSTNTGKKQQMTKAERRAIQEAQRQAKAATKANEEEIKHSTPPDVGQSQANQKSVTFESGKTVDADAKAKPAGPNQTARQLSFFLHLQPSSNPCNMTRKMKFNQSQIHPAFITLGVKAANRALEASNEQCSEFLKAVKELLACLHHLDSSKTFSREFETSLKQNVAFLTSCRPLPVSTKNAIKFLKSRSSALSIDQSNEENVKILEKDVNEYLSNKVNLSTDAISTEESWKNFVKDGDMIMIFGFSSTVLKLLTNAFNVMSSRNEAFEVCIIDSSPCFEGRKSLNVLEDAGMQCTYGLVTSINYLMPLVTKVLIGAHGLLGNGAVMACAGTGLVMLSAKSCNKSVIVCCETFKFSEKIQTDSIVSNELLNGLDILTSSRSNSPAGLKSLWDMDRLNLLNCAYDVSPPSLVSMVVSEVGCMPSLSVPIIYRWKCKDLQDYL